MAAKQGLSAQITQASSDARQAVLTRTPAFIHSHSWLSNLNTTCTIKSAPPRTPEVMSMLSSKAGWLMKRNESHVWQKRWCCVVPHTFLYYFDSCPVDMDGAEEGHNFTASPVGIIDLECYTTIEQCPEFVMEVSGDAITNPDLRSFYFQCDSQGECEDWTNTLLSDRHAALRDEREAYRQVCDTFPLQLKELSDEINRYENKAMESQEEVYRVRSIAEDSRKKVISVVRDALDRSSYHSYTGMAEWKDVEAKRKKLLVLLDKVTTEAVSMNAGVVESVHLLAEYSNLIHDTLRDVTSELSQGREELHHYTTIDREELSALQTKLNQQNHAHALEVQKLKERISHLETSLQSQRQECVDLSKNLDAKKMEFTMLGTSSKQRITELASHKKILKREVIDLRKKVEDVVSEVTAFEHKNVGLDNKLTNEKESNEFLERHLNQVIQQIKLQEKMIDMMSQGGMSQGGMSQSGFSVSGNSTLLGKEVVTDDRSYSSNTRTMPPLPPRITSSFVNSPSTPSSASLPYHSPQQPKRHHFQFNGLHTPPSHPNTISKQPTKQLNLDNPEDDHPLVLNVNSSNSTTIANNSTTSKPRITVAMFDSATSNSESPVTTPKRSEDADHDSDEQSVDDNVSALTEDRTYSSKWGSLSANHTNPNHPPKQLDTPFTSTPRPPRPGSASICSSKDELNTSSETSVAQKARKYADSPKRINVRLPPNRKSSPSRSNSPTVWERLNNAITDVVDSTPLGVAVETDAMSAPPVQRSYTLAERQRQQKEKQMLFLKQQGLMTNK